MSSSRRGAGELAVLRQVVLFHFRRAVFVRSAIDNRLGFEVSMRRRGPGAPLEGVRLPGITIRPLAGEQAPEKVYQEKNLRCSENERADRDENIPVLKRQQKLVLGRIVNPPHMAADTEKMHREKSSVKENIGEHEMEFARSEERRVGKECRS